MSNKSLELERRTIWHPAWDKRHTDANKNYGIHGVGLTMALCGPEGTAVFVVYTNWQLKHVREEFEKKVPDLKFPYLLHDPQPADVGVHSIKPMREPDPGWPETARDCDLVPGGKCYYDGSSLAAVKLFDQFCAQGEDAVWKELEGWYEQHLIKR